MTRKLFIICMCILPYNEIRDFVEKNEKEFDTYDYKFQFTGKGKLVKDSVTVGSGTISGSSSITRKSNSDSTSKTCFVYDYTVNGVRLQAKAHSDGDGEMIDYIAIDGKFLDKESIRKVLALAEKN